jgi:hypothetical protein
MTCRRKMMSLCNAISRRLVRARSGVGLDLHANSLRNAINLSRAPVATDLKVSTSADANSIAGQAVATPITVVETARLALSHL